MQLRVMPITSEHKDFAEIERLLQRVFPKEELVPMSVLTGGIDLASINSSSSFFSFYDVDELCGVMYFVEIEKFLYLAYIGVNDKVQSRGYGSQMLTWLKSNIHKPIIIILEVLDNSAPNAEQRVKRIEFYERNGFNLTDYAIIYNGLKMTAMTTDLNKFSQKEFETFTQKFWTMIFMRSKDT